MISSIMSLLLSIPKLLEWSEKFVKFMTEIITEINNKKVLKQMDQAIIKAQTTKDTSDLDAIFDPRKKKQ